ncbi:sugar diacid recognition domain-containing protein [Priestia taiwanensis]|uniref:CdaR family transcriptional regulator n=1 Tax=Priestia taiwanensis TaxID=1347902 RepID=A0A917AQ67_9BACI|nr:sugar diacid recognition domain-containing protein [Priestia taiwanensis]MBM7363025.1 carbohydrate diacid regulator [Priestia taiwanensis]GGE66991.1 CdaR family transcriptional regulator [Priestia taiwanensis]
MALLSKELAQQIVNRTMNVIHHNINVMDEKGVIIASGEKSRIGTAHEGAILALRRSSRIDIDDKQSKQLQGVKVGTNLLIEFQEKVLGIIGITGDPREVSQFGELMKMTAEMMIEQAYFIHKMEWTNRLKEEFIFSLIYDRNPSYRQVVEYSNTLGIRLDHPWVASLIEVPIEQISSDEQMKRMNLVMNEVTNCCPHTLTAVVDSNYIVLLDDVKLHGNVEERLLSVQHNCEQLLNIRVRIASGKQSTHMKNVHTSYKIAQTTLQIGKILYPEEQVYTFEQLKVQALFYDMHTTWKEEALDESYDYLVKQDKNGELRNTLHAFIEENGELSQVATKLFIHRNTLRYRLNRIYELTGKDPKNIHDLFWLYGAMLRHTFQVAE